MSVRAPLDADAHRVFIALRERLRAGGRFALVQNEVSGDYDLRRAAPLRAGTQMLGWVDQSTSQDDIKALMTGRFKPSRAVGFRGRASLALRGQRAGRPAAK